MKKLSLILLGFFFFHSCGGGNSIPRTKIPGGASLILDANTIPLTSSSPLGICDVTSWSDSSGSGNNGTIDCTRGGGFSGSGTSTDPKRIIFNGTTTFVSTTLNAQSDIMPSSTWVVWVKPSAANFSHILSLDDYMNTFNRSLITDNVTGQYGVLNPFNQVWFTTAVDPAAWQFLAVVFTPSNLIFYKNGVSFTFGNAPLYIPNTQTFTIGRSAGGTFDFFNGSIAWIAIYPRALSATDIKNICQELAPRFSFGTCN